MDVSLTSSFFPLAFTIPLTEIQVPQIQVDRNGGHQPTVPPFLPTPEFTALLNLDLCGKLKNKSATNCNPNQVSINQGVRIIFHTTVCVLPVHTFCCTFAYSSFFHILFFLHSDTLALSHYWHTYRHIICFCLILFPSHSHGRFALSLEYWQETGGN